MNIAFTALLSLLALPAVFASAYLLLITLLSGRLPPPALSGRRLRFDVIVPAHNEAQGIVRTITSLKRLDWPQERFRVLVVADNCTDATADIARAAGATVIERCDPDHRGKGRALSFAFQESREANRADAVVVVDADSEASSNLLEAFAARIECGAHAVQAHYGVLNPGASWRTRLITIAKGSFHIARSRARERLGVSCGLRGNGWCVTHQLLLQVPYNAFSLTEDIEYGIDLGMAGHRVYYADEAHADGEMVSTGRSARKQRQRWEHGRLQLIRARARPLLLASLRRLSLVCLDLALDLIVPPLSYVALNAALLLVLAAMLSWWNMAYLPWLWVAASCVLSILLYVLRGWQLSGVGLRGLLDLAWAPAFLGWKIVSMLRRHDSKEWVRTDREQP